MRLEKATIPLGYAWSSPFIDLVVDVTARRLGDFDLTGSARWCPA